MATFAAGIENLRPKRSRIEYALEEVDDLSDERVEELDRKYRVKVMHATVRASFTGQKRKPKTGDTNSSVRTFVFVFTAWRNAGYPSDGVVLLRKNIAKSVGLTTRQLRRVVHSPEMSRFLDVRKNRRGWQYRPCVDTYDDDVA